MNRNSWILSVLGAALCASGASGNQTEPPLRLIRIDSDRPAQLATSLLARGFDTDHSVIKGDGIELVVSEGEELALAAEGWAVRRIRIGRPLKEQLAVLNDAPPVGGVEGLEGPEIPSGYSDYAGIVQRMNDLASQHPSICQVVDLTERYDAPETHEGRHIIGVRISDNVDLDEAEPAVLIVSAHHSREIGTPVVALAAIGRLVDGYASDPDIAAIVDENEIWIVPVWNPDGYEHVYNVDDFWRKNRRNNGNGTMGVDLNRNYPVGWGQCGGSQTTSSQIYEGPSPASEPETQTIVAFANDRRFAKVADIHSYASEVRYGYGCWSHPWDPMYQSIAADLSTLSGFGGDTRSSCCLGGDIHMHTHTNGALSFLWEIGTSFHPTFTSASFEAATIWNALRSLIERPIPIVGRVTNAWTGKPIDADVELVLTSFSNGEAHRTAPRHGLYHVHAPDGLHKLRFSSPGFVEQFARVSVTAGTSATADAALVPDCLADVNQDGELTPTDFGAWLAAFNAGDPAADQNLDGQIAPTDFGAWLANFNAGC